MASKKSPPLLSPSTQQPTGNSPPILKILGACPPKTFRYGASKGFARPFWKIRWDMLTGVFAGGGRHTSPNGWKYGSRQQNNERQGWHHNLVVGFFYILHKNEHLALRPLACVGYRGAERSRVQKDLQSTEDLSTKYSRLSLRRDCELRRTACAES